MFALFAIAPAACDITPFKIGGGGADDDGGIGTIDGGGNGMIDAGPPPPDAEILPDACIPEPEICDEQDNDCDGDVDEETDLQNDPANCGTCGKTCALPGANGTCVAGQCQFECRSQFHDINNDLNMMGSNGCEYGPCNGDSSVTETCNGQDDDCDTDIDEEIPNLDSDPNNCGECFKQCIAVNVVTTQCNTSVCGYDECVDDKDGVGGGPDGIPDYNDVNPNILGCEYPCPRNPRLPDGMEECNGIDDDCDGTIDELPITGLGDPCGDDPPGNTGRCQLGTTQCVFGVETCAGEIGPTTEICNGIDDDCSDGVDEGFDKQNDPNNCGANCTRCNLPNAINLCVGGNCTFDNCQPGWSDGNDDKSDGCEYRCTPTGAEVCDGLDNDCDTDFDEDLDPATDGPPICNQNGACAGTLPFCGQDPADATSSVQWRCRYDGQSGTETNANGALLPNETLCDEIDGDCDNATDETFPVGDSCSEGVGICQGNGEVACDLTDPMFQTTFCDISGDPGETALGFELCNGLDDDCDGDNDWDDVADIVDSMIGVDTTGDTNPEYFIDTYEASRPDATLTAPGGEERLACSNPDVLPWRTLTWPEAEAACVAAGKRLCTVAEWQRACDGGVGNLYPYGNSYEALSCNGRDYDRDYATPPGGNCNVVINNEEGTLPTGWDYDCPATPDTCVSADGVYDMSGNLKEWTGTAVGGANNRQVMGGGYNTLAGALTCSNTFLVLDDTVKLPTLGFRCCKDAP